MLVLGQLIFAQHVQDLALSMSAEVQVIGEYIQP